jgi:hypothetical protein
MDKILPTGAAVVVAAYVLFATWVHNLGHGVAGGDAAAGGGAPESAMGYIGGAALAVAVGLAVYGVNRLVNYWLAMSFVNHLRRKGHDADTINRRIDELPISCGLKRTMKAAG